MKNPDRARYFRYAGLVVRLCKGRLETVRVPVGPGITSLVPATKGAYPRAARMYAPLPKKYRRELAVMRDEQNAARKDAERRKRMADQGIAIPGQPEPAPWKDLGARPSVALA